MSEQSIIICTLVDFCHVHVYRAAREKCCPFVPLSVTSNSSLSFKAKHHKFCIETPYFNTKKVANGIFEILLCDWVIWVFLGLASQGKKSSASVCWAPVCSMVDASYIRSVTKHARQRWQQDGGTDHRDQMHRGRKGHKNQFLADV